ncbi:MAG TPA: hypothetical protein VKM56_10095, partial [Verrucomicrobiae bacterium]|nr:hypothetical protein [Verrucomicrobiae bacterium]
MRFQPLRYEYKRDNALGIKSEGEHVGFSAQAVQRIIPEAVSRNEKGYLLVNNDPILWTMLNAIKEQQAQIEKLRTANAALNARLRALERSSPRKNRRGAKEDDRQIQQTEIAMLRTANAALDARLRAIERTLRKKSARRR